MDADRAPGQNFYTQRQYCIAAAGFRLNCRQYEFLAPAAAEVGSIKGFAIPPSASKRQTALIPFV